MRQKFSNYTELLSVVTICLLITMLFPAFIFARSVEFTLSSPYWYIQYDRAGYVDITYWYPSPQHPFAFHEMMTGDWAGAVSFSGLNETNTAEWLTDRFIIPDINPTNSSFIPSFNDSGAYNTSNDSGNPVWEDDAGQPNNPPYSSIQKDTGWSKIDNDKLEVKIHYEVVDLAFGDPNNNTARSPMSFVDDNESFYVNSERYVILQTYVFRNITDSNTITGLEFYQMLHGHPADAYSNLAASYNTIELSDPLENYEPRNSVHCAPGSNTVGNFCYDMTQWNKTTGAHKDYLTFSSTVAPDEVGIDEFQYSTSAMRDDIENRNLNGRTSWKNDDMAVAVMWNLPDLEPNDVTSITLALMYGHGELYDSGLWVEKSSNIDPNSCVNPTSSDPNEYKIVYTINYGNDGNDIATNCVLTDTLPEEIDRFSVEVSDGGTYSWLTNTATWQIGTLNPSDSDSVTLTVYATSDAEPGGEITNEVVLSSDIGWVKDVNSVPVCCYDSNTIFVNAYATGAGTGTNWQNAYTDLQDALNRARICEADEIWVARGIYEPDRETAEQDMAFELVDGVPLYGGFKGTETERQQRDFVKNPTILSGDIAVGLNSNKVVVMNDCNSNTQLDGFIITAGMNGVYAEGSNSIITNCIVADNFGDGIICKNSGIEISWSIIKNNIGVGADGIYIEGSTSNPVIFNCKIRDNEGHGIHVMNGSPVIKNSWVHHNDCGISLNSPSSAAIIRGNTICDNYREGIKRDSGTAPDISNCILWGNDTANNQTQVIGGDVTFSCIYDPNTADPIPDAFGNITADTLFAYPNPDLNNYHLHPDSPCKDKGDPNGDYTGEKDIDKEDRVYNGRVDMGADEITCEDVYNVLDWTGNGIVNMEEFSIFSAAWLSHDPNDPGINDPNLYNFEHWDHRCDINDDYAVDLEDFIAFCENWLWQACYKTSQEGTWMMVQSFGGNDGRVESMSKTAKMSMESFRIAQMTEERQLKARLSEQKSVTSKTAKELTPVEQLIRALETAEKLEKLWQEDPGIKQKIDEQRWQDFMNAIYKWIDILEDHANTELVR